MPILQSTTTVSLVVLVQSLILSTTYNGTRYLYSITRTKAKGQHHATSRELLVSVARLYGSTDDNTRYLTFHSHHLVITFYFPFHTLCPLDDVFCFLLQLSQNANEASFWEKAKMLIIE
jgi:hypothetical protein